MEHSERENVPRAPRASWRAGCCWPAPTTSSPRRSGARRPSARLARLACPTSARGASSTCSPRTARCAGWPPRPMASPRPTRARRRAWCAPARRRCSRRAPRCACRCSAPRRAVGAHHARRRRADLRHGGAAARLTSSRAARPRRSTEVRLHRSLERSEERYRLLFEASPLPMWVYDAETLPSSPSTTRRSATTATRARSSSAMTIARHPPARGHPRAARQHPPAAPGSPTPRHVAPPAQGRHADRRRDHGRADRVRGPRAALVLAHDVSERRQLEERPRARPRRWRRSAAWPAASRTTSTTC